MRSELRVCLYPCMNPARRPRCLLILSSTFLSLSWTFFSTSATPPSFTLFFFPILCQELFSIFFPVSLHFFSLSLLQASPRHHSAFSCSLFHCQSLTAFSSLLPCSISHSQSSSQSSLFITHFPLPSLISPAPFMCF